MNHKQIDYSVFGAIEPKPLSPNANRILLQRYLAWKKDAHGFSSRETYPELVNRVVKHVTRGRTKEPGRKEYREALRAVLLSRVFLFNSPALAGAGTKNGLFACFVVGPSEDTITAHLEALTDIAMVGKRGGGCGYTGTNIRPSGSFVGNSAHQSGPIDSSHEQYFGIAYGPTKFSNWVSTVLADITQGGFRQMALMYTLSARHEDIHSFIQLKQGTNEDENKNLNQSVFMPDDIMEKAIADPASEEGRLLREIAQAAWNNGEPGLLFDDTINNNTPYSHCSCPRIQATNPCGEQPLPEYGSCNLGHINLANDFFYDGETGEFRWDLLTETARLATRALDDVGTQNSFPNRKFKKWYEQHRPVGVGIMGLADAFLRLGHRYGDQGSRDFHDMVWQTIAAATRFESSILGAERGIPEHCAALKRRNITLMTVAPTGSTSFIADVSGAIEPNFARRYVRQDERGDTYTMTHPHANAPHWAASVDDDPRAVVSVVEHIDMQAIAQKWVDSAVSKTVNMPLEATVDDVLKAYTMAWETGCKGITVYRNGSREKQVLTVSEPAKEPTNSGVGGGGGGAASLSPFRGRSNPAMLDPDFDPSCAKGTCSI